VYLNGEHIDDMETAPDYPDWPLWDLACTSQRKIQFKAKPVYISTSMHGSTH